MQTARLLGSRWLPALLAPRLKAVVVDLDNTLYDGVLGEDGSASLTLTDGHAQLQRALLALRESGLFLGLLSRNEPADVEALFAAREDFPLALGRLRRAQRQLGAQVDRVDARSRPRCGSTRARSCSSTTTRASCWRRRWACRGCAGCMPAPTARTRRARWARSRACGRLSARRPTRCGPPICAPTRERDQALDRSSDDLGAYYRELGVALEIGQNLDSQLARVADLSTKTNQFNLALARYTPAAVVALAGEPAFQISTARLQDRLTDSGVIAMAVARRDGDRLIVEELCVSCRALGRRLEDLIVAQMLVTGRVFDGTQAVVFRVAEGPRNGPARSWLERFAGRDVAPGEVAVDAARVLAAADNPDVMIGQADEH